MMVMGYFFILIGVIFFFVGEGGSIISAALTGQLSRMPLKPQYLFAGAGFAIWLLGAIMMVAGWIAGKKKKARSKQSLQAGKKKKKNIGKT